MARKISDKNSFAGWLETKENPEWPLSPLTHITGSLGAFEIIEQGAVDPTVCKVMKESLVYTFYGRAGYRVNIDGIVGLEAQCPFCFVFDGQGLKEAFDVYPFDTGAYDRRMYKPYISDDLSYKDFKISADQTFPNRLIKTVFGSRESYFNADKNSIADEQSISNSDDLLARMYLALIKSIGMNAPDDRVSSIEVLFSDPLVLNKSLIGLVVPHTFWNDTFKSDRISPLEKNGVKIETYSFFPGKSPDHYHALIEIALSSMFASLEAI